MYPVQKVYLLFSAHTCIILFTNDRLALTAILQLLHADVA